MKGPHSLLLAASLGLASCASTAPDNPAPQAVVDSATLTVQVVEASGGS